MGCPMFSVVGTVTMGFLVFLGTQLVTLVCTRVLSDVCGRAPVAQLCRKHKMRRCCNYYISLLQHCNKFPAIWIHSFFSCLCFLCVFSGATISFLFHTCSRYIVAPRGSRDQTLRVAAGIHPTSPRLCPPVIAIVR